jgi:hypothetical protein
MSKGLGKIQRRVLDEMAALGRTDTFELTAAVFDVKPSEDGVRLLSTTQLSSVRRAVRRLAKLGLVICRAQSSRRCRQEIIPPMEQVRFVEVICTYLAEHRRREGNGPVEP